jgi:hypothetical protein
VQIFTNSSLLKRFVYAIAAINAILLLLGIAIVPSTLTSQDGVVSLVAAIVMQVIVALFITVGPFAIREKDKATLGKVMPYGFLFGIIYVGILLIEYTLPVATDFTSFGLFIVGFLFILSFVVGFMAFQQEGSLKVSVRLAAQTLLLGTLIWTTGYLLIQYLSWDSPQQHRALLAEGTYDDFKRSNMTDFEAFLLQDTQGGIFFHPILTTIISILFGAIGGFMAKRIEKH